MIPERFFDVVAVSEGDGLLIFLVLLVLSVDLSDLGGCGGAWMLWLNGRVDWSNEGDASTEFFVLVYWNGEGEVAVDATAIVLFECWTDVVFPLSSIWTMRRFLYVGLVMARAMRLSVIVGKDEVKVTVGTDDIVLLMLDGGENLMTSKELMSWCGYLGVDKNCGVLFVLWICYFY